MMTTTFPSMLLFIILTPSCHTNRSTTGQSLKVFGVESALHRDLCGGGIDLTTIVRPKLDRYVCTPASERPFSIVHFRFQLAK